MAFLRQLQQSSVQLECKDTLKEIVIKSPSIEILTLDESLVACENPVEIRPRLGNAARKQTVSCVQCNERVGVGDLEAHLDRDCAFRTIVCSLMGCQRSYVAHEEREHRKWYCRNVKHRNQLINHAHKRILNPLQCEKCKQNLGDARMKHHLKFDCRERVVDCPLKKFGCSAQIVYKLLDEHELQCPIRRMEKRIHEEAMDRNVEIECEWCDEKLLKKHLFDHQENACPQRERPCTNKDYGCEEWIPVCEMEEHVESECVVTLERDKLASISRAKNKLVTCRECGEDVMIRHQRKHDSDICSNRIVPCRNAVQGCTAKLRLRDRHLHEKASSIISSRSCLFFDATASLFPISDVVQLNKKGGIDNANIVPPWTAEFWVWKVSTLVDVQSWLDQALEWLGKHSKCVLDNIKLHDESNTMKNTIKEMQQKASSTSTGVSISIREQLHLDIQQKMEELKQLGKLIIQNDIVIRDAIPRSSELVHNAYAKYNSELKSKNAKELEDSMCEIVEKYVKLYPSLFEAPSLPTTDATEFKWAVSHLKETYQNIETWNIHNQEQTRLKREADKKLRHEIVAQQSKVNRKRAKFQAKRVRAAGGGEPQSSRKTERKMSNIELDLEAKELKEKNQALLREGFGRDIIASSSQWTILLAAPLTNQVAINSIGKKMYEFKYVLPKEKWVHLSFCASEKGISLFADGKLVSQLGGRFYLPKQFIGSSVNSFHGYLQDVRYWNICRTAIEINNFFEKALSITKDGLLGYWTFEEGYGQFASDVTMQHLRSPMQGTKWKKFDENRFLGEPPTEAYQLSQICTAAARRGQMALRAERRNDVSNTETCKQGCGRTSIPVAQLQRHHLETCPCRVIICPRNGCSKMYQFRNMMDHYKTGKCIPYAYRQELLAKHAENESIVLCPLGCGISSLKRRQLKKHITKECCRRTIKRCTSPATAKVRFSSSSVSTFYVLDYDKPVSSAAPSFPIDVPRSFPRNTISSAKMKKPIFRKKSKLAVTKRKKRIEVESDEEGDLSIVDELKQEFKLRKLKAIKTDKKDIKVNLKKSKMELENEALFRFRTVKSAPKPDTVLTWTNGIASVDLPKEKSEQEIKLQIEKDKQAYEIKQQKRKISSALA